MNKTIKQAERYEAPLVKVTYVTPVRLICTSNEPVSREEEYEY